NELAVTVELEWAFTGSRCITFELWQCTPLAGPVIVDRVLNFTGGLASAQLIADVPCGSYSCITVRDKLHTLRRTANMGTSGTQYLATFTGADKLIGGNLNDDFFVDVLDFGVFSFQFGVNYGSVNTSCATAFPH